MKSGPVKSTQNTIDFLLDKSDTDGSPVMFELMIPAGAKVPVTYFHERVNETIYGIKRIITFTVEAEAIDTAQGELCFIPHSL